MLSKIITRSAALLVALAAMGPAASLTPPDKFFGFRLGSDRNMARWDRIVEYYNLLEKEGGGRLRVVNMGPSTMGHPFLLVIVSSARNLGRLERLREVNVRLSNPGTLAETELRRLVEKGRAVICQSMSLHASEIGGTQMAPELAYDLLARDDEEARRILDNVIFLLIPSFNPDGQIMVTDWYRKYVGTEYEGTQLPWLFHKYVGHDNNRDGFQLNMVESRYMASILYREWIPQAFADHHHQYSYGARIYLPPYAEPIRPLADPLVWREMSWYGAHMAYKEEEAGLSGSLNMASYSGWGHFGFHWITPFHNIAGMLTESAHARLATPIFVHPDQLRGNTRGLPEYEVQTTFPNPWPGGWWRLRDILDRQKVAAWALLDLAARNRETVLWNAVQKARRQTERGAQGKPAAYVIHAVQHDRLTAMKMVDKLLAQGIQVHRAPDAFTTAAGMRYPAGSFVVSLAQPKMGLIRYLLGRTLYPDNEWTRTRDGSPILPYDLATDTMFEFMGVRVDPVDDPVKAPLDRFTGPVQAAGRVAPGASAYRLDARMNDSFKAVNLLLAKGVAVQRMDRAPGDFIVPAATPGLPEIARLTGVDFTPLEGQPAAHPVKRLRTGMYQRYRGGSTDEGWTRWLLEEFAFPYTTLLDAPVKKGGLEQDYDVIILPNDSIANITGEGLARASESTPPEYRSGIGAEGVKSLQSFVETGGTLIAMGDACHLAVDRLGLNVRNVVAGRSTKEFWCPASTLKATFDTSHPLAYGMPGEGTAMYLSGNPVLEVVPGDYNDRVQVVARYAARDVLASGWLIGEKLVAGKVAMATVRRGKGEVILIGFRAQHRAQTHGTFKLLFNALVR